MQKNTENAKKKKNCAPGEEELILVYGVLEALGTIGLIRLILLLSMLPLQT